MLLSAALENLCAERNLERVTEAQYRRSLASFTQSIGREPTGEDLSPEIVNPWIKSMEGRLGGTSCRNYRKGLLVLRNYLFELGLVEYLPGKRFRLPKADALVIKAWTVSEIKLLIAAAGTVKGTLKSGIEAKDLLSALLWAGYETGIRRDDLRNLKWTDVNLEEGRVDIIQHKTGVRHTALIGPETVAALKQIRLPATVRIFPIGKFGLRRWEKLMFGQAAKIGFRRRTRQGLGTLRKSHATEVYKTNGLAAAAESLGHVGGVRTVRAHYLDADATKPGIRPLGLAVDDEHRARDSKVR